MRVTNVTCVMVLLAAALLDMDKTHYENDEKDGT